MRCSNCNNLIVDHFNDYFCSYKCYREYYGLPEIENRHNEWQTRVEAEIKTLAIEDITLPKDLFKKKVSIIISSTDYKLTKGLTLIILRYESIAEIFLNMLIKNQIVDKGLNVFDFFSKDWTEVLKSELFLNVLKGYLKKEQLTALLTGKSDPFGLDTLFYDASKLVVDYQQASTAFIQRKLKISYARAEIIISQLEAEGIIEFDNFNNCFNVLFDSPSSLENT